MPLDLETTVDRERGNPLAFEPVSFAASCVGMSRKLAYALLKRSGPESGFARLSSLDQHDAVPGTRSALYGRASISAGTTPTIRCEAS